MSITSVPKTQFGEKLRGLRVALKQTQDTVGVAAGVTGGAISKWELGVAFPNRMYLKRLCSYFGVMLSYFGLESMGEADVTATQAPAVVEKQPPTQQVALDIPQPVIVPFQAMQSQGALPADVQAAIGTILRLPWDAQGTLMSLLTNIVDQKECERRLLAQLSMGGRK